MANTKKKLGAALSALALMVGAVPGTVATASAYENPNGGQHFDRGRFPRTIHIVMLITVVGLVAGIMIASKKSDTPASP